MRKEIKTLQDESGQILLIVFVVLMLLFIILFAIISNLSVDIKETQVEREYETGYSIAEAEIFKVGNDGWSQWTSNASPISSGTTVDGVDISLYCDTTIFSCFYQCGLGENQEGCVIVKKKGSTRIPGEGPTIPKDKVLELDVSQVTGDLNDIKWQKAPAMSIMLVCQKSGGEYYTVRSAVCRHDLSIDHCDTVASGTPVIKGFDDVTVTPALNISSCSGAGDVPKILRLRAIGDDAVSVIFPGINVSEFFDEIHVQGFSAGFDLAKDIPAPELYYIAAGEKQLPALFDYVLFASNGGL